MGCSSNREVETRGGSLALLPGGRPADPRVHDGGLHEEARARDGDGAGYLQIPISIYFKDLGKDFRFSRGRPEKSVDNFGYS